MPKVLIIDDDPLMSDMYQTILAFKEYEVMLAHDGEEGLKKALERLPNLILLDVMMPKINGMQLLGRLKADARTAAIPVVILTNLADDKQAEDALAKGAVRYILKSEYEPADIADMVEDVLRVGAPPERA